jgi:hypothetical protein
MEKKMKEEHQKKKKKKAENPKLECLQAFVHLLEFLVVVVVNVF